LPGYEVLTNIPRFYSTKYKNIQEISKQIEADMISTLQEYRQHKFDQSLDLFSWPQDMFQRTNTYQADISNIVIKNKFICISYVMSAYGAGAAHPSYYMSSYNYLLEPLVKINSLSDCFIAEEKEEAFIAIVNHVRHDLLTKTYNDTYPDEEISTDAFIFEKDWVTSGTETWSNLDAYEFTNDGLMIYFSSYQVAPFALGLPQSLVPYEVFGKYLKLQLKHALGAYFW
jgi:hypothetical protein